MERFSTGAVSFYIKTGWFRGICEQRVFRRLYAGSEPLADRSCWFTVSCLQWGTPWRYCGNCPIHSEAGEKLVMLNPTSPEVVRDWDVWDIFADIYSYRDTQEPLRALNGMGGLLYFGKVWKLLSKLSTRREGSTVQIAVIIKRKIWHNPHYMLQFVLKGQWWYGYYRNQCRP